MPKIPYKCAGNCVIGSKSEKTDKETREQACTKTPMNLNSEGLYFYSEPCNGNQKGTQANSDLQVDVQLNIEKGESPYQLLADKSYPSQSDAFLNTRLPRECNITTKENPFPTHSPSSTPISDSGISSSTSRKISSEDESQTGKCIKGFSDRLEFNNQESIKNQDNQQFESSCQENLLKGTNFC